VLSKKPLDKPAPSPSCPRKTSQRKIKSFSGRHNQDVDTNHCCLKVLADADVHNVVDEETLRSTTMPVFEVRKYFFDVRRSDREDEDAIGTQLLDEPPHSTMPNVSFESLRRMAVTTIPT
jgi:hypothetical protein